MMEFFNVLQHIEISIERKLEKSMDTNLLETIDIEHSKSYESSLSVYHTKLTGKDVVLCTHIEVHYKEELVDVRGSCKFSVCSEDDIYKEEVGASIAIGRVVRNLSGHDFQVRYRKETDIDVGEKVADMVGDRVASLVATLEERNVYLSELEEKKHEIYQIIKQDMEAFK